MSYTGRAYSSNVNPQVAGKAAQTVSTGIFEVVAGVAVGLAALTVGVIKAVNSAQKTLRVAGLGHSLSSVEMKINTSMENLDNALVRASLDCSAKYEKVIGELNEMISREPDMSKYSEKCEQAQEILRRELAEKRAKIQNEYLGRINREIASGQVILTQTREEITKSINRISDDMEKQTLAKPYAEQAIAEAEMKIEGFRSRFGNCTAANQMLNELTNTLNKAKGNLASGCFTLALEEAYIVNDAALIRVKDMLEIEIRQKQAYADTKALQMNCKNILEKFSTARCENEFVAENGIIEDFSRFFRGDYEKYEAELSKLGAELEADYRDISEERLSDIYAQLCEWKNGFIKNAGLAHERLENLSLRYNSIRAVVNDFCEAGYELDGLDELNPLDQMTVVFKNRDGKKLDVKFTAVLEKEHIGMVVDINDHTDYEGTDEEIENKRVGVRDEICKTLNEHSNGMVEYKQICVNPGVTMRNDND